jgi:molybdopterin-guanine dinucleotide biosynthesis protein A
MQPLAGLVVCGGQSSRMGTDKSMLNYHGQEQRYHVYQMLAPFCKTIFISGNPAQATSIKEKFAFITDDEKYIAIGPMAAVLTASDLHPNHSFLVIGCDYPFLQQVDIATLVSNRSEESTAIACYNSTAGIYEPLLCIYESDIMAQLRDHYQQQQYSLQQVLKKVNATKVFPKDINSIRSIDTREDHEWALMQIKNHPPRV